MLLLVSALSGRVTSNGAPLPGATVTAAGDTIPQPRTTTTDARGAFWLPDLPPGEYDVTFSMAGHQTLTRRARVRFGEPTRTNAELAPSEEGESVTMTASPPTILERPRSVWTLDAATLEQLPLSRDVDAALALAPLRERRDEPRRRRTLRALPLDALREASTTIAGFHGDTFDATPAFSGGNDFSGSARLTYEHDVTTTLEVTAGGAAIADRLWFFAAALANDDRRGGYGKLTASPTERDALFLQGYATDEDGDFAALRWSHFGDRTTLTAAAATDDRAAASGHAFVRGHELSAGVLRDSGNVYFLSDRYVVNEHLLVDAGVRHDGQWSPRGGVVYDLHGNGEQRIAANASRDELALTYAQQLGASGYARATALRRDSDSGHDDLFIVDGIYRWLLFTFGGNGTFGDQTSGNLWVQIDPPVLEHDVNVTLLERYRAGFAATDIAVNYRFARMTVVPFVKLEGANLLGRRGEPRTWRLGVGARL